MDWLRKAIDKYKADNQPEVVKLKLKNQIEIERLKIERDKLETQRRKAKEQSWRIGI